MALKNGRTSAALQTILVGSVIPPGVIQAFGGGTVPSGWLLCDGSTASRSTYSALYSAVGVVHGEGDGTTTFHLPDLRGRFLRGADNMGTGAAGRDPNAAGRTAANIGGATGNAVGSVQADAMQGHFHNSSIGNNGATAGSNVQATSSAINTGGQYVGLPKTDGTNGTPKTSSESRPQNANSSYIIKV